MTYPLVSLVIRTFNRAQTLPRAIDCLRRQDWPAKELIVVDDGSTDETRELLREYPDIQYVYQENQGVQGARLTGLRHSTGEFLAYLDSDDIWEPHFLHSSIEQMQKHDAGFSFCHFRRLNGDTGEIYPVSTEETPLIKDVLTGEDAQPLSLDSDQARRLFIYHLPAPTSSFVLRRNLFPGQWQGKVFVMDDVFTILEMIFRHGVRGVFLPQPMMTKFCYPSSVCDGGHHRRWVYRWHVNDYSVLLRNFGPLMTPPERRFYRTQIASNAFELGYLLSQERQWRGAARQYGISLKYRPSLRKTFAMLKLPAKMLMPSAARQPAQP